MLASSIFNNNINSCIVFIVSIKKLIGGFKPVVVVGQVTQNRNHLKSNERSRASNQTASNKQACLNKSSLQCFNVETMDFICFTSNIQKKILIIIALSYIIVVIVNDDNINSRKNCGGLQTFSLICVLHFSFGNACNLSECFRV